MIRFHFYAAQHVLKESLQTGLWWSAEAGLDVADAGEALKVGCLLPEEQWRIYTAAWRDCAAVFSVTTHFAHVGIDGFLGGH